jgi:hypothetical protein
MSSRIDNILRDLYTLEPSLRERELEIITLIEDMLASKPTISIDDGFRQSLRKHISNAIQIDTQKRVPSLFWDRIFPVCNIGFAIVLVGLGWGRIFVPTGNIDTLSTQSVMMDSVPV